MKYVVRLLPVVDLAAAFTFLPAFGYQRRHAHLILPVIGSTTVDRAGSGFAGRSGERRGSRT
jgi:hypothetical protein